MGMEDQGMKILAAIAILAFVGFLAFRSRHMFQSDVKPEPGISKTFIVLIIFVPIILVLLYSMKMGNKGIDPSTQQTFQKHIENSPQQPRQEINYDSGVREY